MSKLIEVTRGVHAFAVPHTMLGLSLGARMTVVRRPDGTLLLHSPVSIDEALAGEIAALGVVSAIVAPSAFHHVYAEAAARRYPEAKVLAARGAAKKQPRLRVDATLDGRTSLGDDLVPVEIDGCELGETVLVHVPSASVISADLVENIHDAPDLYTRLYLKAAGIDGKVGWSRLLRIVYRDRKAARRSLDQLFELPWDRAVIAHGRILERDAKSAVRDALAWIR